MAILRRLAEEKGYLWMSTVSRRGLGDSPLLALSSRLVLSPARPVCAASLMMLVSDDGVSTSCFLALTCGAQQVRWAAIRLHR